MSKSTGVWGGSMIERMLGAARLSAVTYREIANDGRATGQALVVVALVSSAGVVGAKLGGEDVHVVIALIVGLVVGAVNWFIWAVFIWLFGMTLLRTENSNAGWGQLVRATGFAQIPGFLSVIGFIPDITFLILAATFAWTFACMVVAVRQSLDYTTTTRAVFVILLASIPVAAVRFVLIGTG